MTQFQCFLSSASNMKNKSVQENLAITALGSQGDQKSIQKAMRGFEKRKPQPETKGVSPEEFSRRFNGGK